MRLIRRVVQSFKRVVASFHILQILMKLCKIIFRFSKHALHILITYHIFLKLITFRFITLLLLLHVSEERPKRESPCASSVLLLQILSSFCVYKVVFGKQFGNYSWQRLMESFQTNEAWATYSGLWLNVTVNFISNSNSPCCFFPQHFTGSYKHADLIFVYIFLIDSPWHWRAFFFYTFLRVRDTVR